MRQDDYFCWLSILLILIPHSFCITLVIKNPFEHTYYHFQQRTNDSQSNWLANPYEDSGVVGFLQEKDSHFLMGHFLSSQTSCAFTPSGSPHLAQQHSIRSQAYSKKSSGMVYPQGRQFSGLQLRHAEQYCSAVSKFAMH